MCIIMTTEMESPTATTASPPDVYVESGQVDDVLYHDEYVQMALFSLMKNLCTDTDECQTSDTPSIPSTPIDVTDAFQYKLEQAADSVKHHLLYAVREEVDALRGKVSNLERKIYRLEVENTLLLREYVPAQILEQMNTEMTDRYMKRRRSSTCFPPSQQQQQQLAEQSKYANSLPVSIRAADKPHLMNGVENCPLGSG